MSARTRLALQLAPLALLCGWTALSAAPPAPPGPKPQTYWNVDDLRPGMKGIGRTVMKGTRVEPFDAEVLGVLKNISPGRDLVLCRLSGLDLDRTGVIAGMSGSPVIIDGKLLGAVAYAWPFGKEPIAGVTPFSQMHGAVAAYERRDLVEQKERPTRVGLRAPLRIDGRAFDTVTVSHDCDAPQPAVADGLCLLPLRTPVAASGFTAHTLGLLGEKLKGTGLVPMQGGAAGAAIAEREKDTPLEPGGPLAVALIQGDFDLSGIGTVTHIEGDRVYGWGHPFFGIGTCDLPMLTGYIHTVFPRQTVSFKMGSPLRTVGVINADVSTCIAGWLGREPDLMPLKMTLRREADVEAQVFNVKVVRQRQMLPALVYAALTNSVDMQGELPEELTATMRVTIEVEGRKPLVLEDTFSGYSYSGGRAPMMLYHPIAGVVGLLTYNSFAPVRINRIECQTSIQPGRRTADIEAVELDSEAYAPGDTVRATVFVRPYQGPVRRLRVGLKLPTDLPEGSYSATVCDDVTATKATLRDDPTLYNPTDLDHIFRGVEAQAKARRTNLALRVPLTAAGVALDGKALPNLPPSMVQILGGTRRTGTQTVGKSLTARQATEWVLSGSDTVKFEVTKNKKVGLRTEE